MLSLYTTIFYFASFARAFLNKSYLYFNRSYLYLKGTV